LAITSNRYSSRLLRISTIFAFIQPLLPLLPPLPLFSLLHRSNSHSHSHSRLVRSVCPVLTFRLRGPFFTSSGSYSMGLHRTAATRTRTLIINYLKLTPMLTDKPTPSPRLADLTFRGSTTSHIDCLPHNPTPMLTNYIRCLIFTPLVYVCLLVYTCLFRLRLSLSLSNVNLYPNPFTPVRLSASSAPHPGPNSVC